MESISYTKSQKTNKKRQLGAWLAQSVERVSLNLGIVSSSPTLDVDIT